MVSVVNVDCRKQFNSKPPPLLDFRTQVSLLFSFTGVHYIGPLYLRNGDKVDKLCIVQTIHLELVPDLTAEAFVQCLRQFSAQHGIWYQT